MQYLYAVREYTYLAINFGVQYSRLNYFKTTASDAFQHVIYSSDYYEHLDKLNPANNHSSRGDYRYGLHKQNVYGLTGSIGVKKFFSKKFHIRQVSFGIMTLPMLMRMLIL